MNSLIAKQIELQEEASKLMREISLLEVLSKFGKPKIIGSLKLGLMVWRDIDIEVMVQKLDRNFISEISRDLIKNKIRRIDLSVIDNSDGFKNRFPRGIYLGVKYYSGSEYVENFKDNKLVWKIDIWFVLVEDAKSSDLTEKIRLKLTEERKKVILEIKNAIFENPKYKKKIFSVDIYNAVLDNDVKDLKGFKKYLKESGREL